MKISFVIISLGMAVNVLANFHEGVSKIRAPY